MTRRGNSFPWPAPTGRVIVADGPKQAAVRLQRVLTADPATGIFRYADADYEKAAPIAHERGIRLPGQ